MNDHLLPRMYRRPKGHIQIEQICLSIAKWLSKFAYDGDAREASIPSTNRIRVVCISDTLNMRPDLPDGDLLIHAGDLTQKGTFHELQAQLDWLGSQPHQHKVIVAGNHDLILDQSCENPHENSNARNSKRSLAEIDWNGCKYLQNDTTVLQFPEKMRQLTIFGAPNTPDCGNWAFQYPAIRDVWTNAIPTHCDITVTHSPPALHKDGRGIGDGYLLRELRRVKPVLAVFGHAHDGYGIDTLWHDGSQSALDDMELNNRPALALMKLIWLIFGHFLFAGWYSEKMQTTKLVNAAVAATRTEQRSKSAITVSV